MVEAQKKTLMSEFNPAIGLVGETIFSYDSKGSDQTGNNRPGGFDVDQRSIELNIAASVDPFAKGYAVINASAIPPPVMPPWRSKKLLSRRLRCHGTWS